MGIMCVCVFGAVLSDRDCFIGIGIEYVCMCRTQGDYGPFRAQRPVTVPLWLAVSLQQKRRCRIVPPEWLSVDNLLVVRREERRDSDVFQPLPFHYIELAQLLLRDAPQARETFGGGANYLQVSSLVEDIRQIRRNKIKAGLQNLKEYTPAVKVRTLPPTPLLFSDAPQRAMEIACVAAHARRLHTVLPMRASLAAAPADCSRSTCSCRQRRRPASTPCVHTRSARTGIIMLECPLRFARVHPLAHARTTRESAAEQSLGDGGEPDP